MNEEEKESVFDELEMMLTIIDQNCWIWSVCDNNKNSNNFDI